MNFLRHHQSSLVKLLISGSLVGFLLVFAEPAEILNSVRAIDVGTYLLAATLYLLVQLISASKWHLLIPEIRFIQLLKFTFVGAYYSLILPGQVSGEVAKVWRIAKGSTIAEHIAASVFIDRMTGVIALFMLALAGAGLSQSGVASFVMIPAALATLLLLICIFLMRLAAIEKFSKWLVTSIMSRQSLLYQQLPKVIKLLDHLVQYSRQPLRVFSSILIGILLQFTIVLITFVMSNALGLQLALVDLTWIMGIISLLIFLPISISGIGVRELGFVGVLGLFDVGVAEAMTVSLLTFSLQILGAMTGAALELLATKRQ